MILFGSDNGLVNTLGDLRFTSSGIDPVVPKYKKIPVLYCKFRYAVHVFQGVTFHQQH